MPWLYMFMPMTMMSRLPSTLTIAHEGALNSVGASREGANSEAATPQPRSLWVYRLKNDTRRDF